MAVVETRTYPTSGGPAGDSRSGDPMTSRMNLAPALAVIIAMVATAGACAKPLPAGQWAYRYDNGGTAYYDGRAWRYGAPSAAQRAPMPAPMPAPRRAIFAAAAPKTTQWVTPVTAASYGLLATGAGIVFNAHCTVKTISSGETLYVFFIDTATSTQPTNGTAAIFGGVSGGMTAAGNDVSWSDQTYPALAFSNGIMVAASTTPDTYTAPNAADVLRCDMKLRSSSVE